MVCLQWDTPNAIVRPGPIFLKGYKPCARLKMAGEELRRPSGYSAWALSWNTPADFVVRVVPVVFANYMACVKCIIAGQKVEMDYQLDMAYACNRVDTRTKDSGISYYATEDNLRPEQLQNRLSDVEGRDNAIMHDEGSSACIGFKDGSGFAGDGRTNPFWIVIALKEIDCEPKEKTYRYRSMPALRKKDGNKYLTRNFQVKEFACNDGSDTVFVAQRLPVVLRCIRTRAGKAADLSNGYRTPEHNEKEDGAEYSQHLYGTVADISVKGVRSSVLAGHVRGIMPDQSGVGIYGRGIHVDVREEKADWKG